MMDVSAAEEAGHDAEAAFHTRRVKLFTDQLVAANPILTEISDCMTGEGNALAAGEADAAGEWGRRKEQANRALAEAAARAPTRPALPTSAGAR